VGRNRAEDESLTLDVGEAALLARCGENAIRLLLANGSIPHIRFGARGRTIRIPRAAFVCWLNSCGNREVAAKQ
jgi:excisionase family DNA binding protein